MSNTFLTKAIRRDITMMGTLAAANELTPERFAALKDRVLENTASLERQLEDNEPEEFFEVTRTGIHAIDLGPLPDVEPRQYGRLTCIDGGLSCAPS